MSPQNRQRTKSCTVISASRMTMARMSTRVVRSISGFLGGSRSVGMRFWRAADLQRQGGDGRDAQRSRAAWHRSTLARGDGPNFQAGSSNATPLISHSGFQELKTMPRGRPPKSPKLRHLEGNPGKRAIPELLIVPEGAPFAPEHLSDDA